MRTQEQKDKRNEARKLKYAADAVYRAKILEKSSEYFLYKYYNDPEYKRKRTVYSVTYAKNKYATDLEYKAKKKCGAAETLKRKSIELLMLQRAQKRARETNLEFDLTIADIIVPELCPHCNIKMEHYIGRGKRANNSFSVDRKDSSKGYVKGNVQIICWRANNLKSDATLGELKQLVSWMETL
jgi:hypothetical protein